MRTDKQFINQLINTFSDRHIDKCFYISEEKLDFIQDDEETQKCYFTNGEKDGFRIENPEKKEVNLLALDGCFFSDDEIRRCDGIVFDDKELCFFELKLNAFSSKGNKKRKNFKDAIEQLESTINFFNQNDVDFSIFSKEAFVCMNNKSYPKNTATRNFKKVAFLKKNNIPLIDKNIKIFQ